jgi:hypothetical protein
VSSIKCYRTPFNRDIEFVGPFLGTLRHKIHLNRIERFSSHLTINTHNVHYKDQCIILVYYNTPVYYVHQLKRINHVVILKGCKNYYLFYACLSLGLRRLRDEQKERNSFLMLLHE